MGVLVQRNNGRISWRGHICECPCAQRDQLFPQADCTRSVWITINLFSTMTFIHEMCPVLGWTAWAWSSHSSQSCTCRLCWISSQKDLALCQPKWLVCMHWTCSWFCSKQVLGCSPAQGWGIRKWCAWMPAPYTHASLSDWPWWDAWPS